MRVLLVTFGSHGDLFPFLAIGRALARRGHACRVAAHPHFTRDIETAGLEPEPVIARVPVGYLLRHPELFHRTRGPLLGMRHFPALLREFATDVRRLAATRPFDAMVCHYGAISARWVAEDAGVPCASCALTPMAWHSAHDEVPAYQSAPGRGRAAAARRFARLADPALRLAFGAWVRSLRRACGVPPPRRGPRAAWPSVWDEFRAGDLALGLWPEAFRPGLPDDPPDSRRCGFTRYAPPGEAPDPRLEAFLAGGDPPVAFTLGSAAVHHPRGFFALAAAACRRLGVRGVLLTGRGNPPPTGLPGTVLAVDWATHATLFPRAAAVVHHAGIGTTAEALAAGRPSLAVPHAFDQFNNALRVERLGAGLQVPRHRLDARRLEAALERVVRDPALAARAAALAPRMAADGAGPAADAVLEWNRRG